MKHRLGIVVWHKINHLPREAPQPEILNQTRKLVGNGVVERADFSDITTLSGRKCIFPFLDKGIYHFDCYSPDDKTSWCATKIDEDFIALKSSFCLLDDCDGKKKLL